MEENLLIEKIAHIIDVPESEITNHLTFREIVEYLVDAYERSER